jgi:prepilin-type processing-associated H-X9-DG protein
MFHPHFDTKRDPALNMLFCDGHAELVSAKQASYAIRFGKDAAP